MSFPEDTIVLNVLLNCEETKSSETKQVHFQSLPTTPLEIKKKIEEDFSIPSCVQTLHYQSMILKDSDQLQHTHFRSGDTFTVDYPMKAECEMARNVIKWLKELFELLKCIEENSSSPDEGKDHLVITNIQEILIKDDAIVNAVSCTLFSPWKDKKKLMNKFYFQQEGGLDVLMKVYAVVISKEWGDLGLEERFHIYLEFICSDAILRYAQTIPFQRQIVRLGGLEMCMKALLRRPLLRDNNITDTHIYDTLENALYCLCK